MSLRRAWRCWAAGCWPPRPRISGSAPRTKNCSAIASRRRDEMTRLTYIEPDSLTVSPLEAFVREYVEARDGVWDQIEPQVYDLMVGSDIKRVAFDPEA